MNRLFYGLVFFGLGIAWLSGVINLDDGIWGYLFRGLGVVMILIGAYIINNQSEESKHG